MVDSPLCKSCRFSGASVEETVVSHSCSLSRKPLIFRTCSWTMSLTCPLVNDRVLLSAHRLFTWTFQLCNTDDRCSSGHGLDARCFQRQVLGPWAQKTADSLQLQFIDKVWTSLRFCSDVSCSGRCHRFSSSPDMVDIPICTETVVRGCDA